MTDFKVKTRVKIIQNQSFKTCQEMGLATIGTGKAVHATIAGGSMCAPIVYSQGINLMTVKNKKTVKSD